MLDAISHLTTFLVEPSSSQARYIETQLEEFGLQNVHRFASGKEALAAARVSKPDVVISALYLPDGSGAELFAELRALDEEIALILISSETQRHALEAIRQLGVCAIVPKPFTHEQLSAALRATRDFLRRDEDFAGELDVEELRVLLVDDSATARRYMRQVLDNLGIERVVEAADGAQGLALLADTMFDLVITDYNMPTMDGKAFTELIRQQSWQRSVPILMVTSEADQGRLSAVQEAGVSAICDKPFEPATVKRLLAALLAGH